MPTVTLKNIVPDYPHDPQAIVTFEIQTSMGPSVTKEALRKTRSKLSASSIYFCAKPSTHLSRWARPNFLTVFSTPSAVFAGIGLCERSSLRSDSV
jgi:hypothetical protein